MRQDKSDQEAVGGRGEHDISYYLVEPGRDPMDEDHVPEASDKDNLQERPDGDQKSEQSIDSHRRSIDESCSQNANAGQQQPTEEDEGDRDFISMKLGLELSDGYELDRN